MYLAHCIMGGSRRLTAIFSGGGPGHSSMAFKAFSGYGCICIVMDDDDLKTFAGISFSDFRAHGFEDWCSGVLILGKPEFKGRRRYPIVAGMAYSERLA